VKRSILTHKGRTRKEAGGGGAEECPQIAAVGRAEVPEEGVEAVGPC